MLPRIRLTTTQITENPLVPQFASVLWTLTWVQGTSRALLRERHSTLPTTTPPLSFSSHFSRTLITAPHHNRCEHCSTVLHREIRPSPETNAFPAIFPPAL